MNRYFKGLLLHCQIFETFTGYWNKGKKSVKHNVLSNQEERVNLAVTRQKWKFVVIYHPLDLVFDFQKFVESQNSRKKRQSIHIHNWNSYLTVSKSKLCFCCLMRSLKKQSFKKVPSQYSQWPWAAIKSCLWFPAMTQIFTEHLIAGLLCAHTACLLSEKLYRNCCVSGLFLCPKLRS